MTHHIGYIHGSKLEPFLPPDFCQSGTALEEYTYYYQRGYRRVTGKPLGMASRDLLGQAVGKDAPDVDTLGFFRCSSW